MNTTQKMYKDKRSSMERLDGIESLLVPLMENSSNQFRNHKSILDQYGKIINALIASVGPDLVAENLTKIQLEEAVEEAAKTKEHTEKLKAEGVLTPIEAVTDNAVVIATETKPDGTPQGAGWFRVTFNELNEEAKALFTGKKAGETGQFANGNTFEVLEVYQFNRKQVTPETPAQAE